MVPRVVGQEGTAAREPIRLLVPLSIFSVLIVAISSSPIWAKVPGGVHCYGEICHW